MITDATVQFGITTDGILEIEYEGKWYRFAIPSGSHLPALMLARSLTNPTWLKGHYGSRASEGEVRGKVGLRYDTSRNGQLLTTRIQVDHERWEMHTLIHTLDLPFKTGQLEMHIEPHLEAIKHKLIEYYESTKEKAR